MANSLYSSKNSRRVFPVNKFLAGISKYDKGGDGSGNFAFSRAADFHTNPREIQILPASVKESGNTAQDLAMWGEHVFNDCYFIDRDGNIYQRNYAGFYALIHTAPNSYGNGLGFYGEDYFLYYANRTNIGRYGPFTNEQVSFETWANGIDTNLWNDWGAPQVSASNKVLTITSVLAGGYFGIEQPNFNLTGKYVSNQMLSVGSRTLTSWEVYPCAASIDANYQLLWFVDYQNNLKAFKEIAGVKTALNTGTYDAAIHRFFRIREFAGTIYFDYSTDYASWINFASTATPFSVTNINVGMLCGTFSAEASTTSASFGLFATGVAIDQPQFVDDYFGSQGGVPTNTAQANLVSASSQYFTHADAAAYDIISDLSLEAYITPATLPTVGNTMTLIAKWDESSNKRAYKLDIAAISGYFGSGSDGSLTISTNTTDSPIDSTCAGTAGQNALVATNASFAANQQILIIQMQGPNAGLWERNTIAGYTTGAITTGTPLKNNYSGLAQVIVMKQYTNVTVNTGVTYTAKAWNGSTGGILTFLATGTVTITGNINANGLTQTDTSGSPVILNGGGFRGGSSHFNDKAGFQGEGSLAASAQSTAANGNAGGGGDNGNNLNNPGAGGSGGNGSVGIAGASGDHIAGQGGSISGSADLTTLVMGGGGGSGGSGDNSNGGQGGNGGAIIFIIGAMLNQTGLITANGGNGQNGFSGARGSGGGAGAGGSILIKTQIATLNAGTITANGGSGGVGSNSINGGIGGDGRVHLDYLSTYTAPTSTPAINVTQDNSLVTTITYQLRLGISNNGTAFEYLAINTNIPLGIANRVGVSWKASLAQATFYLSGKNIGKVTGTKTAIGNTTGAFTIGGNNSGAAIANFFNGQIDDVRVWSSTRTDDQMLGNLNMELGGNEFGLAAYYKFNKNPNDSTASANNLTPTNTPTYVTTVPFASPTTRLDIDQQYVQTGGNTYTVPTSLTESDLQPFVPAKDPQKSMDVDIVNIGAGDWTIVIHDGLNRQIASVTIPNAQLHTGFMEFIYANAFRSVIGATYHWHIYSSAGSGTINTHTSSDITTARFHTYYQFLIDTTYHPVMQIGNVLGIGNERYLAVQDAAAGYNNQRLRFPAGWHVRCLAKWRNFYAIGCWQGTNITDFDKGIIFFWDGYSVTYNDFIEVPQGGINSMVGMGDELYFIAGYQGKIMVYDGTTAPRQVRQLPFMDRTTSIDILPGAMTVWNNMVRINVALSSTNGDLQRGVYTLGHNFGDEPDALSMDYVNSAGIYTSGAQGGALLVANTFLLVGWGVSGSYGFDAVNPGGTPATSATVEGNVIDDDNRWKDKKALVVRADFKPLRTGESVNVKYRLGYDQPWITSQGIVSTSSGNIRLPVAEPTSDHHEYQVAVDLAQTNGTSPTVLEFGMYEDLLVTDEENPY